MDVRKGIRNKDNYLSSKEIVVIIIGLLYEIKNDKTLTKEVIHNKITNIYDTYFAEIQFFIEMQKKIN